MVSGYAHVQFDFSNVVICIILYIFYNSIRRSPIIHRTSRGKKKFDNPVSWAGDAEFYCFMSEHRDINSYCRDRERVIISIFFTDRLCVFELVSARGILRSNRSPRPIIAAELPIVSYTYYIIYIYITSTFV